MNQVLSTPWRDPGEATGQRFGLPGAGSILGASCPQSGPPGGETPNLQPTQLHGAPGGCRRGSKASGGSEGSQASRDFQVHPLGPGPISFLGRRALVQFLTKCPHLGGAPYSFRGGDFGLPSPPTKQAQPLGAFPPCFPVLRLGNSPSRPPSWSGDGKCWAGVHAVLSCWLRIDLVAFHMSTAFSWGLFPAHGGGRGQWAQRGRLTLLPEPRLKQAQTPPRHLGGSERAAPRGPRGPALAPPGPQVSPQPPSAITVLGKNEVSLEDGGQGAGGDGGGGASLVEGDRYSGPQDSGPGGPKVASCW